MRAFKGAGPAALAGTAILASGVHGPVEGGGGASGPGTSQGAAALLLFNAVTFVGVMLAVLTTPDAPAPAELRGAWKRPGIAWKRTSEALAWTWRHKGPRAALLAIVVFAVLATPIMQLMPLMVQNVYQREEDTFGALLALMGCGAVAGGFAMKLVPKWYPMHHFIPLSILGGGVSILAFSLVSHVALALPIMFVVGFFWMWGFNSCNVAIQHLVSEEMRGRVSAVVNSIALGLMPLGTWVASAAGHSAEHGLMSVRPEWVHPGSATQLGLATVSGALVVAALVMLIWRTPEVDGIEPGQPGYDRKPGLWRGITASAHRPEK